MTNYRDDRSDDRYSVILGAYKNLDLTIQFIQDILQRFPSVDICVGMLGNSEEYQAALLEKFGQRDGVYLAAGKAHERVTFSENWNAAMSQVRTKKFVFLHNDMYVHQDFFSGLDEYLNRFGKESFYLYTTVEPLENRGFVRPGKIVAPFGHSLEDFKLADFYKFVTEYTNRHRGDVIQGYGFYLAGFTESLLDVGGFDSRTFNPYFCEDDDLNVRIRLKGYKVTVVPTAPVYHFGSKTIRLETQSTMSDVEIESNRRFARKWGFEARYLWETGYEYAEEVSIGTEYILYQTPGNLRPLDIINIEPLVDGIVLSKEEYEQTRKYFEESGTAKKVFIEDAVEPNILITQNGSVDFTVFAKVVGDLRYHHKRLVPGAVSQIQGLRIEILKTKPYATRIDPVNYLSLLEKDGNE